MKTVAQQDPAPARALERLRARYPFLPDDYFRLLARSRGAAADLDAGGLQVWSAADALGLTDAYGSPAVRPGYFAFGSDGAGELLVCGLEGDETRPLYRMPPSERPDAALVPLSTSFAELAMQIDAAGGEGA